VGHFKVLESIQLGAKVVDERDKPAPAKGSSGAAAGA
jgi:hypothetical protein